MAGTYSTTRPMVLVETNVLIILIVIYISIYVTLSFACMVAEQKMLQAASQKGKGDSAMTQHQACFAKHLEKLIE